MTETAWPEHVFKPALGVIRAENLGPMGPQPRAPYRAAFGESGAYQLAVNRSVRAADASTVLLDVEVLRVLPDNGMMLVLIKDAYLGHMERPRLDGRINWIDSNGAGYPVAWLPAGIVSLA
jgi:hypothetical protein